jgi:hypothetical protein
MSTRRQITAYQEISDIFLKVIITIVVLGCFVTVLIFLLTSEAVWQKTAPLSAIELLMAGSFYPVIKHFFPRRNT